MISACGECQSWCGESREENPTIVGIRMLFRSDPETPPRPTGESHGNNPKHLFPAYPVGTER